MKIIDISQPLAPSTAVFPGDTSFSQGWVFRMEEGGSCNVSALHLSPHCGTHADAPLHLDPSGMDIASVSLEPYVGPCRVLQVSGVGEPPLVPAGELTGIDGVERLLLRTHDVSEIDEFDPGFTALGPEAAKAVVAAGVKLVGLDTPSMDHASSKELSAHHILIAGGVAILENLDLSSVEPGDFELLAVPLRIVGGDASPVRAILRELGPA